MQHAQYGSGRRRRRVRLWNWSRKRYGCSITAQLSAPAQRRTAPATLPERRELLEPDLDLLASHIPDTALMHAVGEGVGVAAVDVQGFREVAVEPRSVARPVAALPIRLWVGAGGTRAGVALASPGSSFARVGFPPGVLELLWKTCWAARQVALRRIHTIRLARKCSAGLDGATHGWSLSLAWLQAANRVGSRWRRPTVCAALPLETDRPCADNAIPCGLRHAVPSPPALTMEHQEPLLAQGFEVDFQRISAGAGDGDGIGDGDAAVIADAIQDLGRQLR